MRSFQAGDTQAKDFGDAFVQVAAQWVVPDRARRIVIPPHKQQRHPVPSRQAVEVLSRQVAAAEEEVDRAKLRDGPLVEELRVLLVADREKSASRRYSNSLNNGVTSRWKTGRSTNGWSLSAGTLAASWSS